MGKRKTTLDGLNIQRNQCYMGIESRQKTITAIQGQIGVLNAQIAKYQYNVETLEKSITNHKATIADLEKQLEVLNNKIVNFN